MQIPLLTCPRCLGVIVNPNAAARARQPQQVLPVERDIFYDLRDTVGGLSILVILLIIGGAGAIFLRQMAISVILIGCGMMVAGFVGFTQRKRAADERWNDAILSEPAPRGGPMLEYSREVRVAPSVSILGFIGGFIFAIVIGIACFYAMIITGDRSSVWTRRLVFILMIAAIVGLIFLAAWASRKPAFRGLGRGVVVGLVLSMMALGPCGACYMLTLFG